MASRRRSGAGGRGPARAMHRTGGCLPLPDCRCDARPRLGGRLRPGLHHPSIVSSMAWRRRTSRKAAARLSRRHVRVRSSGRSRLAGRMPVEARSRRGGRPESIATGGYVHDTSVISPGRGKDRTPDSNLREEGDVRTSQLRFAQPRRAGGVRVLRAVTQQVVRQHAGQHRLPDRHRADAHARDRGGHGCWTATSCPCRSTDSCGIRIELVGLTANRATIGCPVEMPPRMPPAWLAPNTTGAVADMRMASAFSSPCRHAAANPAPISTPLTALMPISAAAMSASSFA